jgi:hypothetical protein
MTSTERRQGARSASRPPSATWRGPTRGYDLLKEFVIALAVVALLTTALAALFSSPDEPNLTLKSWAGTAPGDFVATATGELAGTTTSATYGPPYNSASDGMSMGPVRLQKWAGSRIPVDSANDFVVAPLATLTDHPDVTLAVERWKAATIDQRSSWATGYADALAKADNDPATVTGDFGPVPTMTAALLGMAQRGVLDSDLISGGSAFFHTDYTKPLLFLADGTYLEDAAIGQHLAGDQWGMMNETGNYPGQAWLWLYTFWYQVPPFTGAWADNADVIVWTLMMVLSLALVLLPFIPGLRSIPHKVPVYRLIWRDYYRSAPRR